MSMVRLTKRVVDAATPKETRFTVMDDELAGFGIRVEPSGVKTYFIRYRANGGGRNAPQRLMTIGRHGPLTPDQARKEAKRLLGSITTGADPAGERSAIRRELSVADLIDLYEAEGCFIQRGVRQGEPMKCTSKKYTLARLRNHIVPLLGKRRVSEITPGDIERFAQDISNGKSAKNWKGPAGKTKRETRVKVRGGEGAARKVVRDFSAVFSFAKRRGIVNANPVENAAVRKVDGRRERFLSRAEFQRFGVALDELEAEDEINRKAINIVRLWTLTGCRRNEISGLKWSEVDLSHGVLRLDDTKSGKSVRPLGGPAISLLSSISRDGSSPYVFPAERGDGFFNGTKKVWNRILEKAGLDSDVTPHVLRHSVGAMAASSGEPLLVIGAILGHSNTRSTAIYAHIALDPAIEAANRVAGAISKALSTRTAENGAQIEARSVIP